MTRENAHKRFRNADMNIKWSDFDLEYQRLLDDIFDDFEELSGSKQIVDNHKTCEGCKYYIPINKSNTMVCSLSIDCIRKYVPKDRWESKE